MDIDLAAAHQSIDLAVLGSRLKNKRVAAGMTQGEVAGDSASIAYVSRIEAGKRRPELALLATLADRLDSSLEELLLGVGRDERAEFVLELDYADLSLRSGAAAEALEKSTRVADAVGATDHFLARNARVIRALAHEALGDLDEAIIELEDLLRGSEDSAEWVRCAIALVRCYRESGDLTRATEAGERALERLRSVGMDALDESIQLSVTLASVYNERGDTNHAIRLCRIAARTAEALDSTKARAGAYWNAAIMESDLGRVHAALPLAKQALALLESEDDNRNLAKLHSQLGMFLLAGDAPDPAGAKASLERAAIELEWSAATVVERGYNTVALARAHLALGDLDTAEETLATLQEGDATPLLAADASMLRGQILGVRKDSTGAQQAYLNAVKLLTAAGADRSAAQMWVDLGTLLDRLGEVEAAKSAFLRAAASTGLAVPRNLVGAAVS